MLFTLGTRSHANDIVDLLLACHRRIVEHLVIARRIANADATTNPESIRMAAHRVRRYFGDAFPLHKQDEEDDIFPRLLGRGDELDAAIGELIRDHDVHDAQVAAIVELCARIEHDPTQHRALASRLTDTVQALGHELDAHMKLEERIVFPAIAMMATLEKQEILVAMRNRRDLALAS
jgi:iron-sulfur cluster repair protein YtfE (RIC family)